ncbi:MAG: hypothetical protein A2Y33_06270 [Spirochaetes bacterium GWF1_51_8]|nr:MAG: hypothetical protein A2Y33_06270 [Spirochaetes bacterium GWF1_51_8]
MRNEIPMLFGLAGAALVIPAFFTGGVGIYPSGVGLFIIDMLRIILPSAAIVSGGFILVLYLKERNPLEKMQVWFVAVSGILLLLFSVIFEFTVHLTLGGALLATSGILQMEFIRFRR